MAKIRECKICDEILTSGYWCKECRKKYNKEYQIRHSKRIAERSVKYYNGTIIERRNKKSLEKYGCTKEERKIRSKELERLRNKEYYIINKDKLSAYSKEYFKKNRKTVNEKLRQKLKEDNTFRLATRLRTLIYAHLKRKGISKLAPAFKLTGCTHSELRNHLESLFLPGMSWSNHSREGWHIDHIKPCSKFDLTIKEEQYKCFHYSNLQPLWAIDNIKKGNRELQLAS